MSSADLFGNDQQTSKAGKKGISFRIPGADVNYSCFFHENMVNFLVPVFYSKRNLFFPFLSNSDFCFCCDLFLGASGSFSGADLSQLKDGMVRVTGKVRFQAK